MTTKKPYLLNTGRNYHKLVWGTSLEDAKTKLAVTCTAQLLRKGRVHEALLTERARTKMKKDGLNDTQEFGAGYIKRHVDKRGQVTFRWAGSRRFRTLAEARRYAERWAAAGERAYVTEHWYDGVATRALAKFFR